MENLPALDPATGFEFLKHHPNLLASTVSTILGVIRNRHVDGRLASLEAGSVLVTEERQRLREALEAMAERHEELYRRGMLTRDSEERRGSDPEFVQFVHRGLAAAVGSQSEGKRRIFGGYIARRLTVEEEDDIVLLRRAMALTDDLTERQLLAIAAIVMVRNFENPVAPFAGDKEADSFAVARYGPVLERFKARPWTQSDLDMLSAVGALSGGSRGGAGMWAEAPGEVSFDGWMRANGLTQPMYVEARPDRTAPSTPTLRDLRSLTMGHLFGTGSVRIQELDISRIDTLSVTPVGWVMGEVVLEQLMPKTSPLD